MIPILDYDRSAGVSITGGFRYRGTRIAPLYGAYLYEGNLPIPVLVSLHAMTIIGPTLLKIGYVMRLLSQHRLGQRLAAVAA